LSLLLYYFDSKKKTAAETHRFISETYSEFAPSVKTCQYWQFKSDDFDLKDKECSSQPKKKMPNCIIGWKLGLNAWRISWNIKSTVSGRLHVMRKIQEEGK